MADTPSTNTHHDSFEGIRREGDHGSDFEDHFADMRKLVGIGSGVKLKETPHL